MLCKNPLCKTITLIKLLLLLKYFYLKLTLKCNLYKINLTNLKKKFSGKKNYSMYITVYYLSKLHYS